MMRIMVTGAFEAGSQWAHAINTVKMAQGFAELGHEVLILCSQPRDRALSIEELGNIYAVDPSLQWVQARRSRIMKLLCGQWSFAIRSLVVMLRFRPELVFTRDYFVPWLSSLLGFVTAGESHAHTDNRSYAFRKYVSATRRSAFKCWVTISRTLARHYETLGTPADKLLVLPDAVDLGLFSPPPALPESPYNTHRPVIVYTGHLYDYKGIPAVLEAAAHMPEADFHFVGGWPDDVERHREKAALMHLSNIYLHGLKPHTDVPRYLWHANVLLLPPSANHPSAAWTSPVKLAEYLASGTPIVATGIPALRDWLSDREVCFVEPDNGAALASGIRRVLNDSGYAKSLSMAGLAMAKTLSYRQRATRIIDRIFGGAVTQ